MGKYLDDRRKIRRKCEVKLDSELNKKKVHIQERNDQLTQLRSSILSYRCLKEIFFPSSPNAISCSI